MKTVEFRDGERDIPDHVAEILRGVDTFAYTYDEAVRLSEQELLRKRLNDAQRTIVDEWMRRKL